MQVIVALCEWAKGKLNPVHHMTAIRTLMEHRKAEVVTAINKFKEANYEAWIKFCHNVHQTAMKTGSEGKLSLPPFEFLSDPIIDAFEF